MTESDVLEIGAKALGVDLSPEQLAQYIAYLDGLRLWNERTNLTSPSALANAVRVHVLDSLTLVPILRREMPQAKRLADVGSGAGFPGLALKVAMPDLDVVLIEATGKKAEFLDWTIEKLGLGDVEVLAERAEAVGHRDGYREEFDVVTARAVGSMATVLELTLPLCKVGGVVLAPRGTDAIAEAQAAEDASSKLGGGTPRVAPTSQEGAGEHTAVVVVSKTSETPKRYPRRDGMPAKRPLA